MIQKIIAIVSLPFILVGGGNICLNVEEISHQTIRSEKENIAIQFQENSETKYNVAGVPLLTIQSKFPTVKIKENDMASKKINTYYEGVKKELATNAKELLSYAEQNYGARPNEDLKYWNSYSVGLSYSESRVDDQVISLIRDYYEFAGGAHPNNIKWGENFSSTTGEKLTLKDITTDEIMAKEEINEYILALTKQDKYNGYFFEGYEKDLPNILTDNTWYFSREGLVVIANEYIIGPHALGILEFTIPYTDISFLKNEYSR